MENNSQLLLSILLFNENDKWIAQCLEWDIAAQDDSPKKALQSFETVFWTHVLRDKEKDRPILGTVEAAPKEYWDQFEKGMPLREAYPLRPPASVRIRADLNEIRLAA